MNEKESKQYQSERLLAQENQKYYKTEFVIREKVLDLDNYIRKNLTSSIPAVDRDVRIHLLDEVYNIVKNLHFAIYSKGNIRIKYLTEILVNISLVDYLIGIISKYKNVNKTHITASTKKLMDVRNMLKSWRDTEESKKHETK